MSKIESMYINWQSDSQEAQADIMEAEAEARKEMERVYFSIRVCESLSFEVYAIPFFTAKGIIRGVPQMQVRYAKDDRVMAYILLGYGKPLFRYAEGNDHMGYYDRLGQAAIEGMEFKHPWEE